MSAQKQYVAVWPSGHYVKWRGLSMREHAHFTRRLDLEPEMAVFCDLYRLVTIPEDSIPLDRVTAGVVDYLGRHLLLNSAFTGQLESMEAALAQQRDSLQRNYLESCKAVLAAVFRYSFEEIEDWDEQTFFERLAKAELISGEDLGPKKIEDPKTKKAAKPVRQKKLLTTSQATALERVNARSVT